MIQAYKLYNNGDWYFDIEISDLPSGTADVSSDKIHLVGKADLKDADTAFTIEYEWALEAGDLADGVISKTVQVPRSETANVDPGHHYLEFYWEIAGATTKEIPIEVLREEVFRRVKSS